MLKSPEGSGKLQSSSVVRKLSMPILSAAAFSAASVGVVDTQEATAQEVNNIVRVVPNANNIIQVGEFKGFAPPEENILSISNNYVNEEGVHCAIRVNTDNNNSRELICPDSNGESFQPYAELPDLVDRIDNYVEGISVCALDSGIRGCDNEDGFYFSGRQYLALFADSSGGRFFVSATGNAPASIELTRVDEAFNSTIEIINTPSLSSLGYVTGLTSEGNSIFVTYSDVTDLNNIGVNIVVADNENGRFSNVRYISFPSLEGVTQVGAVNPLGQGRYLIFVNGQPQEFSLSEQPTDTDNDGIADSLDNCPQMPNPNQANVDGDSRGDACDPCPEDALDQCGTANDTDGDGVLNAQDNCPNVANANQSNVDGDNLGDACDPCNGSDNVDTDSDGICNSIDACPSDPLNACTSDPCADYPENKICESNTDCPAIAPDPDNFPCVVTYCAESRITPGHPDLVCEAIECSDPRPIFHAIGAGPGSPCQFDCDNGTSISGTFVLDEDGCTVNVLACQADCGAEDLVCQPNVGEECQPTTDPDAGNNDTGEDADADAGNNNPDTGNPDGDIVEPDTPGDDAGVPKPKPKPTTPPESCSISPNGAPAHTPEGLKFALLAAMAAAGIAIGTRTGKGSK